MNFKQTLGRTDRRTDERLVKNGHYKDPYLQSLTCSQWALKMRNSCPEAVNKNIFLMCIKVWKNFVKLSQQHLLLDPVEANFRPTIRKFSRKKLHHIFQEISKFFETTMPESVTAISQKRSFPLSISSVNMTKSAGNESAGIFLCSELFPTYHDVLCYS